ncbi:MAG TPA: hypothetical protein VKH42_21335, partial [Vicinamibacterales bacterium]|nr:hypothetical protein [Vicinamibacterales bacterium]
MDDRAVGRRPAPAMFLRNDCSHPITDGRKVRRARRVMAESTAHLCPRLNIAGEAIQPALLFDDARKAQISAIDASDLCFEKRMPPQTFAYRHVGSPSESTARLSGALGSASLSGERQSDRLLVQEKEKAGPRERSLDP